MTIRKALARASVSALLLSVSLPALARASAVRMVMIVPFDVTGSEAAGAP